MKKLRNNFFAFLIGGSTALSVLYITARLVANAQQPPLSVDDQNEGPSVFPPAGYELPVSGMLTDNEGKALPKGEYKAMVSLYSSEDAAAPSECSSEMLLSVDEQGQFEASVQLDNFSGFDWRVVDGRLLYLGIRINKPSEDVALAESPEMHPRIRIVPVLFAKNAGLLSNVSWPEIDERLRKLEEKTKHIAVADPNAPVPVDPK